MEDFLWVEKYRPRKVADTILPDELKQTFQEFVDQGNVPNLILCGGPGVGKTTVAKAMLEEIGADYIIINGSLDGNIDTLRNKVMQFASSVSFTSGRKFVIFDEADYLNPQSTQPSLRNFMEEFSRNCGFILTANYKKRIIEPLHSRCSVIDFKILKKDMPKLAGQFFKRVCHILEVEGVTYDRDAIGVLISRYFPDWRRTLNELQKHATMGHISADILGGLSSDSFKLLLAALKDKQFTTVRKWVGENSDIDSTVLFRALFDGINEFIKPESAPSLILTLADYQHKAAFVADPEINIMACLAEIMRDVSFK